MAAIIFLMNTLTGCALKNENMEAIYKEFLDNGDVGSLQWSWVLEPGQYEDIRFVNDNMVAVQNGSDKWGVWDLGRRYWSHPASTTIFLTMLPDIIRKGMPQFKKTENGVLLTKQGNV